VKQHGNETDRNQSATFEDRLLAQLRATVAERGAEAEAEAETSGATPAWRRGPRLALAGAAVTTVAAAALLVSAGGDDTTAAYAVEPQGDGMVSVEIRSLSDADGLEKALDDVGVPASVNYLPAGEVCDASQWKTTEAVPADAATGAAAAPTTGTVEVAKAGGTEFSISRNAVGPGQTLVLTASPGPDGSGSSIQMAVAEGDVGPCEPTTVTDSLPTAPPQGADEDGASSGGAPNGAHTAP
jgi:hypothetical protein